MVVHACEETLWRGEGGREECGEVWEEEGGFCGSFVRKRGGGGEVFVGALCWECLWGSLGGCGNFRSGGCRKVLVMLLCGGLIVVEGSLEGFGGGLEWFGEGLEGV